jgi:hypothetical protein
MKRFRYVAFGNRQIVQIWLIKFQIRENECRSKIDNLQSSSTIFQFFYNSHVWKLNQSYCHSLRLMMWMMICMWVLHFQSVCSCQSLPTKSQISVSQIRVALPHYVFCTDGTDYWFDWLCYFSTRTQVWLWLFNWFLPFSADSSLVPLDVC